jgi:hypothetical protein
MSQRTSVLPEQFADLDPYVDWGLPTEPQRLELRDRKSDEELKAFYDAMLPRLHQVAAYLNQFPLNQMPDDAALLFRMARALMEISNTVEKGRSGIAWAFPVTRFIPMHEG